LILQGPAKEVTVSIRLLAQDLYRLIKEVEDLQTRLETAHWDRRAPLEEALRKKKAERDLLRGALDGKKD
jgi:hypothetical protein